MASLGHNELNCQTPNISHTLVCANRQCSNYIFIIKLTPGFNGLGKDNCNLDETKINWVLGFGAAYFRGLTVTAVCITICVCMFFQVTWARCTVSNGVTLVQSTRTCMRTTPAKGWTSWLTSYTRSRTTPMTDGSSSVLGIQKVQMEILTMSVFKGAGIILWMHPVNERWRYILTSYLIAWAYSQNDPWGHQANIVMSFHRDALWILSVLWRCWGPSGKFSWGAHWIFRGPGPLKPLKLLPTLNSLYSVYRQIPGTIITPYTVQYDTTLYTVLLWLRRNISLNSQNTLTGELWGVYCEDLGENWLL